MARALFAREFCTYTNCYCEENIWKLCESLGNRSDQPASIEEFFVVFISNDAKKIPLWRQRSRRGDDEFVLWDYHVILLHVAQDQCRVYDQDTTLPFPCSFKMYVRDALRTDEVLRHCYRRMFRVVRADAYLAHFASDRSHMKTPDGDWIQIPPSYPSIHTAESTMNIYDFISMDPARGWGDVLDYGQFVRKFELTKKLEYMVYT
uniref:protein N-terminal glutamine amidohydrolase n=1 Tax=Myxine glutinosa TaxID=7769 RepID=UPI00358FE27A